MVHFGQTGAHATIQRFIKDTMRDYLDDILIYSIDRSEHARHVRLVLHRPRDAGQYAKPSKRELDVQKTSRRFRMVSLINR